jgi:hypothetical protein
MKALRIALIVALVLTLTTVGSAFAQTAYNTNFITSITYLNVGTGTATVQFSFYQQGQQAPTNVTRTVNAGAGSALFVGSLSGNEALAAGFLGSAVMSSNQSVVATLVQVPQPSTSPVKNRPLSNGFSSATSKVLLATVLKNTANTTSKFSIQNAHTGPVDMTLKFFDAANPAGAPIVVSRQNVPAGSAQYFDLGTLNNISAAAFSGSATVEAVQAGSATPANIVGSVLELSVNGVAATAFEGVSGGNNKVFVATALCNVFGGANTAYAVQNVDPSTDANVVVTYKGVNTAAGNAPVTGSASSTIKPGAKFSFLTCQGTGIPNPGFNGAATIESNVPIVVIAKVFGRFATAWLGEGQGSAKLAMPYVRYSDDANYTTGKYQRTFLAIQNVGSTAVSNVTVEYRDKNGGVVGTHTIPSIEPGAKAASNPTLATGDAAKLLLFGNPESNPGGGFGGGAIISGPTGSQLIAVGRVQSKVGAGDVAEDYNGISIQ